MAKAKKGTAKRAFEAAHENKLTKLGWPSAEKLAAAYRAGKDVMPGLNLLANMSGDPATKAKARAIRERLKNMKKEE